MDSLHDTSPLLTAQAHAFVLQVAEGGPAFLAGHFPQRFMIGTPSGGSVVDRDRFIEAAQGRAALVAGLGLAGPELVGVDCAELGDAYALLTAHWVMRLPGGDQDLIEDLLVDRTGPEWVCLAYLLRQDLPGMLT